MSIFVLKSDEVMAITNATHGNPHHILGMHTCLKDCFVNAYQPEAVSVSVIRCQDGEEYPMEESYARGFFTVKIKDTEAFTYRLKVTTKKWGDEGEVDEVKEIYDPYSFECTLPMEKALMVATGEDDIEQGFHVKDIFGARVIKAQEVEGVSFCMNMPGAVRVSVVGDFNGWDGRINPMRKIDYTDIFELFIPGDLTDSRYKFEALYSDGRADIFSDPYAVAYEVAPGNASMLSQPVYEWKDGEYMSARVQQSLEVSESVETKQSAETHKKKIQPVNIYEVHMPTWRKNEDGSNMNYRQFGKSIATYVKSMGYTYVEFMPLMEYKDDNGWGYDTVGMFAPTSRFGSPADFMSMVDYLHGKGIGVIMDMVPVKDIDCISYWIDTYHLDGVRLDDVELVDKFKKITGDKYSDVFVGMPWKTDSVAALTEYMMVPPNSRGSLKDYMSGSPLLENDTSVWALSHDEVAYGLGSYASKMSGGYEDKYADLRILFGLAMTLPGRKLTFMGQELGGFVGFDGKTVIDWSVLDFDANSYFQKFVKELNKLYNTKATLNAFASQEKVEFSEDNHVVSFVRNGEGVKDNLYIVCNLGLRNQTEVSIPVGVDGKYKEIFSSDNVKFGGEGNNNKGLKASANGQLTISAPALSFAIFEFSAS
jgi:1,4-alpha-glucan branching enzyme